MTTTRSIPEAPRVSPEQVAAFRLSRHHLAERAPRSTVAQVAGDMAGAHAQVLSAAQMSLWTRTSGLTLADVEKALWKDRTLVKARCMRGSLHLIPSDEFAVFVHGCARREARSAAWFARAGIPIGPVNRVIEAVPGVLDQPLTRREIAERVSQALHLKMKVKAGRGWGGPSNAKGLVVGEEVLSVQWLVYSACMRGLACFGPMRGNEATFVRPDRWLPNWRDLPQGEAERELLRRYLRAHGPANVTDFAMWTYMKAADARAVWSTLEDELSPVRVDGRVGWVLNADLPFLQDARLSSPSVRLLPFFDSLLLGLEDKSHLVDAVHYKRVYRPQGWLSPVVLVRGRAVGVWSHKREGRALTVRIGSFQPFRWDVRNLVREEVDDLGRFLRADEVRCRFAEPLRRAGPESRPSRRSSR